MEELKRTAMFSFISHEKSLLEYEISDLDYSTYKLVKDSFSQSRILSKKVNKALKWFDIEEQKAPWWTFVFYGLPVKFFASKEAAKIRIESKDYLSNIEREIAQSPTNAYVDMRILREKVKAVRQFIDETNDLTKIDLPFTIEEMAEFERKTKSSLNYANLKQLEKTKAEITERIQKSLDESHPGKDYLSKKAKIETERKRNRKSLNPFRLINEYQLINKPENRIFQERYDVELITPNNQAFPEKVPLELLVSKVCETNTGYNLVIRVRVNNIEEAFQSSSFEKISVIEPLQTRITLVYPQGTSVGEATQSGRLIYSTNNGVSKELEEIIPDKTDKIKLEAIEGAYNKSLHMFAEGNITRIKNILGYLSEKISESERGRDSTSTEIILERLKSYEPSEISLANSGRQSSEFVISLPMSNIGKNPTYLLASLGVRDWNGKVRGRIEDIIVKINNENLTREGNPKYDGWIIPSSWLRNLDRLNKVIVPIKVGGRMIISGNGVPEYATLDIAGKEYSFIDDDFVQSHSLNDSEERMFNSIKISTEKMHFEYKSQSFEPEDLLKGIFFAEQSALASYIREAKLRKERSAETIVEGKSKKGFSKSYPFNLNLANPEAAVNAITIMANPFIKKDEPKKK